MTRILQIRRGTTQQNNNFTGLSGEMSFDTESKALRIHDGQTKGGFELAKKSEINNSDGTGDFSIENVGAEFWEKLFNQYATNSNIQTFETDPAPVGNYTYMEMGFDTTCTPLFADIVLVCQTPNAGYSVGEYVSAYGIGNRANPKPNITKSENAVKVRLPIGQENFWVSHKETGISTNIDNDCWKIIFKIYC